MIDSIGSLLTVIKSYKEPASETLITYIISGISGVFGLLAVGSFEGILLAYPAYIVVANFAIVGAIVWSKKTKTSNYKA